MPRAAMTGVASAVPDRVVPNSVLGARLGVDDNWIRKRTGVAERRIAGPSDTVAELAAAAGRAALQAAGCDPAAIDLVLVATMTPDLVTPHAAAEVVGRLDGMGAGALDVNGACVGWLGAVALAAGQVESGRAERVLVIGADVMSRIVDPGDPATACIFADGAGAVLVAEAQGAGRIGPVVSRTNPAEAGLIRASQADRVLRMNGGRTFSAAVEHLVDGTRAAATAAGVRLDEIDLFAYHQANGRIIRAVGERLGLPSERVLLCIERFGNTAAASIPMALAEAAGDGRLVEGARVLMGACAPGFSWAATVVEWGGTRT